MTCWYVCKDIIFQIKWRDRTSWVKWIDNKQYFLLLLLLLLLLSFIYNCVYKFDMCMIWYDICVTQFLNISKLNWVLNYS
jgi:hypothetical protein